MNEIHPTAVIGPGVVLGADNVIGPYAVLLGPIRLGDRNWIGPGVTIGTPPEIRDFAHTAGWLGAASGPGVVIGDDNVIRDGALLHQGSRTSTTIGSGCFIMNRVYLAHDCVVGDSVVMAASVTVAGQVRVGAGANLGMGALIHQHRWIGASAMVGMGAVVTRDVRPYVLTYGSPAHEHGLNVVGMRRASISDADVAWLAQTYGRGDDPAASDDLPLSLREAFESWPRGAAPQRVASASPINSLLPDILDALPGEHPH